MLKPRFIIRIQTTNLRVEIWVNEIPVSFLLPNEGKSPVAIPVNQFLVKGRNKISVVLHAGPVPSKAGDPWTGDPVAVGYSGAASLSLTVAKEVMGQNSSSPPLVSINWEGVANPQPSRLERDFMLDEVVGPWTWETAVRFSRINSGVSSELTDYLQFLHGLLAAKQFDGFMEESAVKLEELAMQAYGVSVGSMRQAMLQALQSHSVDPYKLRPLDIQEVDMRIVAGGRMVECLRKDRGYVLEYVEPKDSDKFFLPTMVGKVGARWQILR